MTGLPSFKRPPVVETVLGVQFNPLAKMGNRHLGAFWATLDWTEWGTVREVPAISQVEEQFGDRSARFPSFQVSLQTEAPLRYQIRSVAEDRMIQIQNGWFVYNWLAAEGRHEYPRYDELRPSFDSEWDRFASFVAQNSLGPLQPNLWEVTYVNHFAQGSVWEQPIDWAGVLPQLLGSFRRDLGMVRFEDCQGAWRFEIPDRRGRLHIELTPAARTAAEPEELDEILVLKLTARGPIVREDAARSLDAGLNLGHEAIVQTFAAVTSDAAHDYWGPRSDGD